MPPRLPAATKKARGTFEKPRKPKAEEPGPPPPTGAHGTRWVIDTIPPAGSEYNARDWAECAAAVNGARCATHSDSLVFGELVRARQLLRQAAAEIASKGFLYETQTGTLKANPAVSVWSQATKAFGALADRFGLSPAVRERVASMPTDNEKDEGDQVERFLFGNIPTVPPKETQ